MESFKLQNEVISFRCENCQEVINDSSNICRFCGFEISDDELRIKSETQTKVNQAYNDASNLKILGIACLAISVPRSVDDIFVGYFTNSYVNYFPHGLILIFLFFLVRWQYNFGKLKVNNEDFKQSKQNKNFGVFLWLVSVVLVFILVPIIENFVFSLF
jgi:hypothetical protein